MCVHPSPLSSSSRVHCNEFPVLEDRMIPSWRALYSMWIGIGKNVLNIVPRKAGKPARDS